MKKPSPPETMILYIVHMTIPQLDNMAQALSIQISDLQAAEVKHLSENKCMK